MTVRLAPFTRPAVPPGDLRLQPRDWRLLETLQAFDGLLSLRQIDRLFFAGQGASTAGHRLRKLFHNGYLDMAGPEQQHRLPLGETVYWLGQRGLEALAGLQGEQPARQRPRLSLLAHDLALNDLRIAVMQACKRHPGLDLELWLPESELRREPDAVSYRSPGGKKRRRAIIPDAFFRLAGDYAFLLEVDMGTEHHPRFAREKVAPGLAYLGSKEYQQRFGLRYGRWLVVTKSEAHLRGMREGAARLGAGNRFLFSTFERLRRGDLLRHPLWLPAGGDGGVALVR